MSRNPTPLDAFAEQYLQTAAALSPIDATQDGIAGHEHELDDFSPAGHAARADAARHTLAGIGELPVADEVDRVTVAAMQERLGLQVELHEAGEDLIALNVIASPLQVVREVFDLMSTATAEDWETISTRISAVPSALRGYQESLRASAAQGLLPAQRQFEEGIKQARDLAAPGSFWDSFTTSPAVAAANPPQSLPPQLARLAEQARAAYAELAQTFADLLPQAPAADGVGRDRYALHSRRFLGAAVDLDETYEWGRAELERVVAEQTAVAAEIAGPGATVAEAVAILDQDPQRQLQGTAALQAWLQETSDAAISALNGTQFEIPEPLQRLECRIAPTQEGGIYYTGPTEDFSRPGRMWWSVPREVTSFNTWREKTTCYHEGVPGHHLQIGQAVYNRAELNQWRRQGIWVSGHGEGWALYAERLMESLGFLEDPGDRLGMLDGQRLRAARVVLDLGVHLGKPYPGEYPGGEAPQWNAQNAHAFLLANVNMPPAFVQFELNRYLGWPGQAPSYKIGQRVWEQIRDEHAARPGFDLREFHARALNLGALGLDTLREALA